MVMMDRFGVGLLCLVSIACGPATPSETTEDAGASTTAAETTGGTTHGELESTSDDPPDPVTSTTSLPGDESTTGPPPFWCNGALNELTCVEEPMTTPITGTTPLGEIELPWGYGGIISCGSCFSHDLWSRLYFLPTYEDAPVDPYAPSTGLRRGDARHPL